MYMSSDIQQSDGPELNRRRFLKLIPLAALACIAPPSALAARLEGFSEKRSLSFYNIHTQESLQAIYWINGKYQPDALARINYVLRDHRAGQTKPIDIKLLDLLHVIDKRLAARQPFHVISGYRSPETNVLLRKQSGGVARQSYHMLGKAVDISIPGCRLSQLRDVALNLKRGGVGYYPRNDFIHVDVGPVRYW